MRPYRAAKRRVEVSVGESVRIIRELQGFSQNQLAHLTGIPQTTISAIENERVRLGVEAGQGPRPCPEVSPGGAGLPRLGLARVIGRLSARRPAWRRPRPRHAPVPPPNPPDRLLLALPATAADPGRASGASAPPVPAAALPPPPSPKPAPSGTRRW